MTVLHCYKDLILKSYKKLSCVKVDFLVHSYPS